jgi:hypothetical protein
MGIPDYSLANENSFQTMTFEAAKCGKITPLYMPDTISLARYIISARRISKTTYVLASRNV